MLLLRLGIRLFSTKRSMINMSSSSASKGCTPSVYIPVERLGTCEITNIPLSVINHPAPDSGPFVSKPASGTQPPRVARGMGELGPLRQKLVQAAFQRRGGLGRWSLRRIARGEKTRGFVDRN